MQVSSSDLCRLREHLERAGFRVVVSEASFVSTLFEIAFIEHRDSIRDHPSTASYWRPCCI